METKTLPKIRLRLRRALPPHNAVAALDVEEMAKQRLAVVLLTLSLTSMWRMSLRSLWSTIKSVVLAEP